MEPESWNDDTESTLIHLVIQQVLSRHFSISGMASLATEIKERKVPEQFCHFNLLKCEL